MNTVLGRFMKFGRENFLAYVRGCLGVSDCMNLG